ncbi:hypothetical protein AVEN_236721-1, partial [Araneus ventricosus]
ADNCIKKMDIAQRKEKMKQDSTFRGLMREKNINLDEKAPYVGRCLKKVKGSAESKKNSFRRLVWNGTQISPDVESAAEGRKAGGCGRVDARHRLSHGALGREYPLLIRSGGQRFPDLPHPSLFFASPLCAELSFSSGLMDHEVAQVSVVCC